MGTGVFATCRACDYRVELRVGSSRSNYLTSTEWPVWCDACGKMDTTNYMQRPLSCYHCKSTKVTRPEAKKNTRVKQKPVITSLCRKPANNDNSATRAGLLERIRRVLQPQSNTEDLGLHGAPYRCPECNEHQLHFSVFMHYD